MTNDYDADFAIAGRTELGILDHLGHVGTLFRKFLDQDSGFVSYGVEVDRRRWFVKHSATGPIHSLRGAIRLHRAVRHRAIVPLCHVLRTADGLALVYPWVDGEVLYDPATARGSLARTDPASAHARFRAQPVDVILDVIDELFDAHLPVSRAGFVAVDWYDGCLLYDFDHGEIRLIDLDEYRPGPFVVSVPPLPGSRRFRPPEHHHLGRVSDDRSTVFQLGRTAQVLLDTGDLTGNWRASAALAAVAGRATAEEPGHRYKSVDDFINAWRRTLEGRSA